MTREYDHMSIGPGPSDVAADVDWQGRTLVDGWPEPVQWLNYDVELDGGCLGQIVGPMDGQDDVFLTIVRVDGKRAGLTYGTFALREKP